MIPLSKPYERLNGRVKARTTNEIYTPIDWANLWILVHFDYKYGDELAALVETQEQESEDNYPIK